MYRARCQYAQSPVDIEVPELMHEAGVTYP